MTKEEMVSSSMLNGPHIDIPDIEENRELFETAINWEKEEGELLKKEKELKKKKKYRS